MTQAYFGRAAIVACRDAATAFEAATPIAAAQAGQPAVIARRERAMAGLERALGVALAP